MTTDSKFNPIRKGLLEFLILQIISADKVYVADMMKRLQDTDFATQEGTLYPLLSKMRREELVDYEWQESDSGPPRKYYSLSPEGERVLEAGKTEWQATRDAVDGALGLVKAEVMP